MVAFLCRYLFQHKYRLSLPELIERIASPLVKQSLEDWSYRDLGSWPTPKEYAHIIGTGSRKALLRFLHL